MHIGECEHGQQPAGLVHLLCLSGADELQHLGSRAVKDEKGRGSWWEGGEEGEGSWSGRVNRGSWCGRGRGSWCGRGRDVRTWHNFYGYILQSG